MAQRRTNLTVDIRFKDNGVTVYNGYGMDETVFERRQGETWYDLVERALPMHAEACHVEGVLRDKAEKEETNA